MLVIVWILMPMIICDMLQNVWSILVLSLELTFCNKTYSIFYFLEVLRMFRSTANSVASLKCTVYVCVCVFGGFFCLFSISYNKSHASLIHLKVYSRVSTLNSEKNGSVPRWGCLYFVMSCSFKCYEFLSEKRIAAKIVRPVMGRSG